MGRRTVRGSRNREKQSVKSRWLAGDTACQPTAIDLAKDTGRDACLSGFIHQFFYIFLSFRQGFFSVR